MRLIRTDSSKFSLYSQIVSENQRMVPVGVERDIQGDSQFRVNERNDTSIIDMASYLPIRLINSQSHLLFESGPMYRRKFLDWGLFYHFTAFMPCWRQYERALRQRNSLLKQRRPKAEINPWTDALVKYGLELDALRRKYINEIKTLLEKTAEELLDFPKVSLRYDGGWDETIDFATALEAYFTDEIRFGHTQYGPHRADLDICIDGVPAKHILSRGQQKLLICAMIIAQGRLLAEQVNKRLIYLIDDLPSELDLQSRTKLIALLSKQNAQIFVTAIEKEAICELTRETNPNMKVFHVEHGKVTVL
jgi:DNA replication and repair protein RecF